MKNSQALRTLRRELKLILTLGIPMTVSGLLLVAMSLHGPERVGLALGLVLVLPLYIGKDTLFSEGVVWVPFLSLQFAYVAALIFTWRLVRRLLRGSKPSKIPESKAESRGLGETKESKV